MTTCLILGGNGFLGSYLAEGLVKKGYDVRVFDSFQIGMANLETIKGKIEIIKGDFLNHADVLQALKGMDYIFHYIGTTVPAPHRLTTTTEWGYPDEKQHGHYRIYGKDIVSLFERFIPKL